MEKHQKSNHSSWQSGQALVEYTLIAVLVILAFAFALAATGPAVGNVFSNTVINLLNAETPLAEGDFPAPGEEFWGTVTAVFLKPPAEFPLPTRTVPPPADTATPGPSPLPTATVPTNTPQPTPTPPPTSTPQDKAFPLPFHDSADVPVSWRLDSSVYLGAEGWRGSYYANTLLSGAPDFVRWNEDVDPQLKYDISFRWGSGGPKESWPTNNFGVIWRRRIYVANKTTLSFDNTIRDDGLRIWILGQSTDGTVNYGGNPNIESGGPGNCSNVFQGGTRISTGVSVTTNQRYDDARYGYNPESSPDSAVPKECLIFDSWQSNNTSSLDIRRTVLPGFYTIQVEYYDGTGDANIELFIRAANKSINPDDTKVDNGGNPTAGNPQCRWGQAGIGSDLWDETNTQDWMWDEYTGGDMPANNRCYMELRGWVDIPAGMSNPVFSFWDWWDFQNSGLSAWVEFTEYIPIAGPQGGLDRVAVAANGGWKKVNLHVGNTSNFNWTYQHINLNNVFGGSVAGKRITFRFVMETKNVGGSTRRWFIDDIHLDQSNQKSFYFAQKWNLDTDAMANDFITSGRWKLTTRNARTGMSWEDSPRVGDGTPGTNSALGYDDNDYAPGSGGSLAAVRAHTIEFNGLIDVNDPLGVVDLEGDASDPMLSFWHAYDLGRYTGLEIQYTTDNYSAGNGANWKTVPGGQIRSVNQNGTATKTTMDFVEINLADMITEIRTTLGIGPGQPTPKFRLRFAMLVRNDYQAEDGWWIDDIQLERRGAPKFTNYPYFDPAETPNEDWLLGGSWGRVSGGAFDPQGNTYTDSPAGNYLANQNSAMELRYPIDMRLDTPTNPKSPSCNLGAACQPPQPTAPINEKPILTFWHWRKLSGGEDFFVEWRQINEGDNQWKTLWAYINGMATRASSPSSRTYDSVAWERVEVDLTPILNSLNSNNNPAVFDEDDIVIRIRFKTDGGTTDDGLYIDDIRIENRVERTWQLWPIGEQRTDSGGNIVLTSTGSPALGSGSTMLESIENSGAFLQRWYIGGEWRIINWEQWRGLYAFHDSPGVNATDGTQLQRGSPPYGDTPYISNGVDTFNVLEMGRIIDLRGLQPTEIPIMYFWSRYYIRSNERLMVQISTELPGPTATCASGYVQCYEHYYGWSEWETAWEVTADRRTYTWQREQVSLAPYMGKRIRIRWVTDALDGDNNNEDGWYVDEIEVKYYQPRIFTTPFFDGARNMQNWVAEGKWGLDPEFFRGGGGGPASLGSNAWNAYFWNAISCNNNFPTCVNNNILNKPNSTADRTTLLLDINEEYEWGGPFPDWQYAPGYVITDRWAARFELTTPIVDGITVSPGTYTFITISDDGVRMKYETSPTGNLPSPIADDPAIYTNNWNAGNATGWNIINNWTEHGRTVDMGTARLVSGYQYKFTVEHFDKWNKAVIIVTAGSTSFSFTDSPKQGNGPAFPEVPSVPYSNSSLILDGVFDLSTTTAPIIQYYTYYETNGIARYEVTTDGGFTWTQEGMRGTLPPGYLQGSGWTGEYFNNKTFSGAPAGTRTDANINFSWSGSPGFGIGNDNFSVRWTRQIVVPAGGVKVTFTTRTDDGVRLWIRINNAPLTNCHATGGTPPYVNSGDTYQYYDDAMFNDPATGCLLMDDWENQGVDTNSVTRTLPPGTHTIQMDYFENTGNAFANLEITTGDFGIFNDPNYNGTHMPTNGDWQLKSHDLKNYAGQTAVGMRFRLDNLSRNDTDRTNQGNPNWLVSWWIVDITVVDP